MRTEMLVSGNNVLAKVQKRLAWSRRSMECLSSPRGEVLPLGGLVLDSAEEGTIWDTFR
jgi:hypothetical protein